MSSILLKLLAKQYQYEKHNLSNVNELNRNFLSYAQIFKKLTENNFLQREPLIVEDARTNPINSSTNNSDQKSNMNSHKNSKIPKFSNDEMNIFHIPDLKIEGFFSHFYF
jgi:hypothetical protein